MHRIAKQELCEYLKPLFLGANGWGSNHTHILLHWYLLGPKPLKDFFQGLKLPGQGCLPSVKQMNNHIIVVILYVL